ncbi:hypothetical protein TNCV_5055541 [Trichonephila clavipes]|nr:hypothetical protein TNCV_5055541 [Trichonephila clavipes]
MSPTPGLRQPRRQGVSGRGRRHQFEPRYRRSAAQGSAETSSRWRGASVRRRAAAQVSPTSPRPRFGNHVVRCQKSPPADEQCNVNIHSGPSDILPAYYTQLSSEIQNALLSKHIASIRKKAKEWRCNWEPCMRGNTCSRTMSWSHGSIPGVTVCRRQWHLIPSHGLWEQKGRIQAFTTGTPLTNTIVITAEMESGLVAGDDLVPFHRSRSQFRRERHNSKRRRQGQHTQSQMSFSRAPPYVLLGKRGTKLFKIALPGPSRLTWDPCPSTRYYLARRPSLIPDLVLRGSGRETVIVDFTVAFEDRYESLVAARNAKIFKYQPILESLRAAGKPPYLDVIVVGALGSWDSKRHRSFRSRDLKKIRQLNAQTNLLRCHQLLQGHLHRTSHRQTPVLTFGDGGLCEKNALKDGASSELYSPFFGADL